MVIYIKDMVCVRCKMAVQSVLEELGIPYKKIEYGFAELNLDLTDEETKQIDLALKRFELSLMSDRKKILTERIKVLILEWLKNPQKEGALKLSVMINQQMSYDYTYLANLFSEVEGTTIERYYIENRIERAKELMIYEGLSAKEVTYELHYSSVSHFSLQFKKVTGYTPAEFKKQSESSNFIWKTSR
jgi:AraC family transcriptional regulator